MMDKPVRPKLFSFAPAYIGASENYPPSAACHTAESAEAIVAKADKLKNHAG